MHFLPSPFPLLCAGAVGLLGIRPKTWGSREGSAKPPTAMTVCRLCPHCLGEDHQSACTCMAGGHTYSPFWVQDMGTRVTRRVVMGTRTERTLRCRIHTVSRRFNWRRNLLERLPLGPCVLDWAAKPVFLTKH
jgi:hypothetical protein